MLKVAHYPKVISQEATTLILGSFGAIHLGHLQLIETAKELKRPIAVLIFANPEAIPSKTKSVYASLGTRLQQLANLGVSYALVLNFNDRVSQTLGPQFLAEVVKLTKAQQLVIGDDFAMGHNRTYNASHIRHDYPTALVVKPLKFNQAKLSTTILKELVEVGDMALIQKLAPFPYTIEATLDERHHFVLTTLAPHRGIYACYAAVGTLRYAALVLIGFTNNAAKVFELVVPANLAFGLRLEFCHLIRPIVKEEQATIELADEVAVLEYFQKQI